MTSIQRYIHIHMLCMRPYSFIIWVAFQVHTGMLCTDHFQSGLLALSQSGVWPCLHVFRGGKRRKFRSEADAKDGWALIGRIGLSHFASRRLIFKRTAWNMLHFVWKVCVSTIGSDLFSSRRLHVIHDDIVYWWSTHARTGVYKLLRSMGLRVEGAALPGPSSCWSLQSSLSLLTVSVGQFGRILTRHWGCKKFSMTHHDYSPRRPHQVSRVSVGQCRFISVNMSWILTPFYN